MRLSEAIRKGAKLRPQCTMRVFSDGKSCVLGAALEGMTGVSGDDITTYDAEMALGLECDNGLGPCPVPGCHFVADLGDTIAHLNDGAHNWSRERIASWVAKIERGEV